MVNANGTIILNGVTDKQMELIWGFKAKHGAAFSFTPSVMQPNNTPQGVVYNNVNFTYGGVEGLNLIAEIVNTLNKPGEQAKVADQ